MMAQSDGIAYQREHYLPLSEVSIPLLAPAFTKSDAVFDVVSVRDGQFFRLNDHMARFRESCDYVRMTPPLSEDQMKQSAAECVDRAERPDTRIGHQLESGLA